MAMLDMFAELSPRPNFSVVTVNHGIRAEAQSDCDFVSDFCNKIGVECQIVCVDAPAFAKSNKVSEETAARILRYDALNKFDCDYVCLAHHADDNAETVLMHILRGSGASGAKGIARLNGKYFRPLLSMTRSDIENYAKKRNLPFVTDSTNEETDYTRNFVRHKVMPLLKEINPNATNNILRFAENISCDDNCLESMADVTLVQFDDNEARIPLEILHVHKAIASRIFRKTLHMMGIDADVERTHIDALFKLVSASGGKRISLPFGIVAFNDYDKITLRCTEFDSSIAKSVALSDFCVPFRCGTTKLPFGKLIVSDTPIGNALRVNSDIVSSGAVVRFRKEGDVFTKFGGGTKSLKKYLIDKKIPQRQRDRLPLVAINNDILVVCGVEISDKVKATDSNVWYIFYMED